MKKNRVTIGTKSRIKIDNNVNRLTPLNLFKKKFDESRAALLQTDLSALGMRKT